MTSGQPGTEPAPGSPVADEGPGGRLEPGGRTSRRSQGGWWPYIAFGVVLVILLRAFVVQSFSVPSESMQPTIEPGDRLLVNRFVRGDDVQRGDIVVFDGTEVFPGGSSGDGGSASGPLAALGRTLGGLLALDTGTDYVKRVIGLPGDRVACCDASGRVAVNGVSVDEPYLLPGDRPSDLTFDVRVPEGHLWVMGDHRSASGDSRSYLGRPGGGMVPVDEVIGQVTVRYWPPGRLGSLGGPGPVSTVPSPAGAGQ
ncbi:MAG TPA: signal peptidase I [Lapillicoccus sp.]